MAFIQSVRGFVPKIGKDCFLAENAAIIGDTIIGDNCSIWYGAVLRGDVNSIRIGNHVNIQDGAVLHTLYEKSQVHIGDYVSVGHNAIIHACNIGNNTLIAMGATVLTGATIGNNCLIAAGAVVSENAIIPDNSLVVGIPAKVIKQVGPAVMERIKFGSDHYVKLIQKYKTKDTFKQIPEGDNYE
jgi:carbonic anhydrase/acetyltransferase-like protein (isoleucine patch superfamily)